MSHLVKRTKVREGDREREVRKKGSDIKTIGLEMMIVFVLFFAVKGGEMITHDMEESIANQRKELEREEKQIKRVKLRDRFNDSKFVPVLKHILKQERLGDET